MLQAQEPEINWGTQQKISGKDYFERVVYGDTNGIYVLRSRYTGLGERFAYLDFFSSGAYQKQYSAELVGKETYKGTQIRFRPYFENIFRINNRLILFLSTYDHEKDRHYAYAQYLDDAGAPAGELVQVAQIKATRKSNRGKFHFTVSGNEQYVMIVAYEPQDLKYADERFSVTVLDTSLKALWGQDYTLPYKEQDYIPLHYQVDDQGNAYILSKVYLSKEQQKDKDLTVAEYYYTLLQFRPDGEDGAAFQESVFQLEGNYIINMVYRFDDAGKIRLTGYYASRKDLNKVKGIYTMVMTPGNRQPDKISLYELEDGFVPDFATEAPMRFGEEGEPELELTHYILLEDGSTILVAEHVMISEVCFTDFRTALTTCNYSYYYNDIFVVKTSKEGNIEWKIRVPKRQLTRNDNGAYSSFALGLIHGKVVLLYNENTRNLQIKSSNAHGFMSDPGKSTVVAVEIDPNGHTSKHVLFSNLKRRSWFKPRLYYQYNHQSLVLFSHRVRIYQYGELH